MELSVVTICYNCWDEIQRTVESVCGQSYDEIEYIVIDGDSTDGTKEWLKDQRERFDVFVSEPDSGIYDAMNKGLERASGEYVMFLNGGDWFVDDGVIERVLTHEEVRDRHPTIVSGRIEFMLKGKSLDFYRPFEVGKEGPGLPHPATMVDCEVHQEHPFDDQFAYAGDYELWARLRDEDLYDVLYLDEVVSMFDIEGISNTPETAYRRYLERSFIDYKYQGEFDGFDAFKLLFVPFARHALQRLLGHRRFIRTLRYRRLVKRRVVNYRNPQQPLTGSANNGKS